MVVNTVLVFSFVALWHDLTFRLLAWGWLVSSFIIPELCAKYLLLASKLKRSSWLIFTFLLMFRVASALISLSVPDLLLCRFPLQLSSCPVPLLTSRMYVMRTVRTKAVVQTRLCLWGRTQHYDNGCQFRRVRRGIEGVSFFNSQLFGTLEGGRAGSNANSVGIRKDPYFDMVLLKSHCVSPQMFLWTPITLLISKGS